MLCLAPLVLIGHLLTIQTSWHKTTSFDGQLLQVQTCEEGLGVDVKLSTSGLYGIGLQYGWQWEFGASRVVAQPKIGVSYVDRPEPALPLRTQFEIGWQLLYGYNQFRFGVEYWHLSNAGLRQPNIGVDLIAVTTGWAF